MAMHGLCPLSSLLDSVVRGAGTLSQFCHVILWPWAMLGLQFPVSKMGTVVLEKTLESPLDCKKIKPVDPKGNQPWLFIQSLATWYKELTHWKRPWCWEGLGAGGEGGHRGWDGCMASPTRWTWVWVHSRSWWWTGRPGVLISMGSQRVRHDWVTELDWTEFSLISMHIHTV